MAFATTSEEAKASEARRQTLAVLPFWQDGRFTTHSRRVTTEVEQALAQAGHYQLVDRSRLETIIDQQKLESGGLIDVRRAAELGGLANADRLVYGELATSFRASRRSVIASVTVNARLIDTQRGTLEKSLRVDRDRPGPSIDEAFARALRECANELAREWVPSTQAQVVAVDATALIIDRGVQHGVSEGDIFQVQRRGEPIKNAEGVIIDYRNQDITLARVENVNPVTAELVPGAYKKVRVVQTKWQKREKDLPLVKVGDAVVAVPRKR